MSFLQAHSLSAGMPHGRNAANTSPLHAGSPPFNGCRVRVTVLSASRLRGEGGTLRVRPTRVPLLGSIVSILSLVARTFGDVGMESLSAPRRAGSARYLLRKSFSGAAAR